MRQILIIEAGSTKTDWALTGAGADTLRFTTRGINALLSSDDVLAQAITQARSNILAATALDRMPSLDAIHYYGAGCATPDTCGRVAKALASTLSQEPTRISVDSDLVAAARAIFGPNPGVACILGTGSNSGVFDGCTIVRQTPSLGYILGDEGSGTALGKRLVTDVFKGLVPEAVKETFLIETKLSLPEILHKVYREPDANRWLASLVPFIDRHIYNPYLYSLVLAEFRLFIRHNLSPYPGLHSLPIGFAGSIACGFEDILARALDDYNLRLAKVVKSPIDLLISYHLSSPAQ